MSAEKQLVQNAKIAKERQAARPEVLAAHFVAGEACAGQQKHGLPGRAQARRQGTAGRPCANDRHVPGVRLQSQTSSTPASRKKGRRDQCVSRQPARRESAASSGIV